MKAFPSCSTPCPPSDNCMFLQVTFTSLRLTPGGGGSLLAGGWSSKKGSEGQAEAFVVAEINPAERLVTFKTAKVMGSMQLRNI